MKCQDHKKQITGTCQWCGKRLCLHCFGKKLGSNKVFCGGCSSGELKRMIEHRQIQQLRAKEEPKKAPKPPRTEVYF